MTNGFSPFGGEEHFGGGGPLGAAAGGDSGAFGEALQTSGLILGVGGLFTSAIGAFFAADAQKYQLESQALTFDHRSKISAINARRAELDAHNILKAGRQRRALASLRHGQQKATARARQGSRGIQAGVGSAGEELASFELAKELDLLTIDANTFRAVTAARRGIVDAESAALLGSASAANLRRSASTISPGQASFPVPGRRRLGRQPVRRG